MPIEMLKKLPKQAMDEWETVYLEAKKKYPIDRAAEIAWSVIKKKYKKNNNEWVLKSCLNKTTVIKSGFLDNTYKFEFVLTDDKDDTDDERIDIDMVSNLIKNKKVKIIGDVDHELICREENRMDERETLNKDVGTFGLYYLDKIYRDDDKVKILVGMNKKHKLYDKYFDLHKQGRFLNTSIELKGAVFKDNKVVDAEYLGWSITDNPANIRSRLTDVYSA